MSNTIRLSLLLGNHLENMVNVASVMADFKFNILSLESQKKGENIILFLMLKSTSDNPDKNGLLKSVQSIPNWIETKIIKT